MAQTDLLRCSGIFINAGKQSGKRDIAHWSNASCEPWPVPAGRSLVHATASARRHGQY